MQASVGNRWKQQRVATAVRDRVADAVETEQNYRQVLLYALFVAAYMVALYLQASAYSTAEVVTTLRELLMPGDNQKLSRTKFYTNKEVLDYVEKKLVAPFWRDPVCGDGVCEEPLEFPAFGRFGCRADCGRAPNTTLLLVRVRSNFGGHPLLSPRVLQAAAAWNLCLEDAARRKRGDADLCWYEHDQAFTAVAAMRLETMAVVDGRWYIYVKGDYAGRVHGAVFNISDPDHPKQLELVPWWSPCRMPRYSQVARMAAAAATEEAGRK